MLPVVPALKNEFVPAAVVVRTEEPNWLMEPPTAVTSKRLALAVGRTTLPALDLKTDGPPEVTDARELVELMEEPTRVTLLPETAPLSKRFPVVDTLIVDPPRSERTAGARVAETPPPPAKTIVGVAVKPEPAVVVATVVTEPVAIAAVPVAPVPPPPEIVTLGTVT
jgi:hypothetical protein